jgi:hypothetical protein
MNGLTSAERSELPKLIDLLIESQPKVRELTNGYEIKFAHGKHLFPVATKWVAYENRCCPFFDLSVSIARNDGPMVVRITGPDGVKAFIAADLPKIHALTKNLK